MTECVYPYELDDVRDGDRYYRYVEFETLSGDPWTATLESSEDTVLVLFEWDTASESWTLVEMNDDIQQDNTNSRIEWTSVAGQSYLLDVTTYEATTLRRLHPDARCRRGKRAEFTDTAEHTRHIAR